MVARAGLMAISVVALIPAAMVVAGGYFPHLPALGPFGRLLIPFLPLVLAVPAAVVVVALLAWRLIRGPVAIVLLAIALVTLAGGGVAPARLWLLAQAHGASFSLVRQVTPEPPIQPRRSSVVYATVDGEDLSAE